MTITGVELSLPESLYGVYFEFRRGSDTAVGERKTDLHPSDSVIPLHEVFEKTSIFYLAEKKESYYKKKVDLAMRAKSDQNKKKDLNLGEVEFDCSQYVGQRKAPLTLHLKGSKHSAKLHVEISIQEGGQQVDDESSGDENALESPDKGQAGAPTGDFSLEAYAQKQVIDKQKVSLFVSKYLQAQIADLEEAYNNLATEKHSLETQTEEWKELLKVKEEEIQHLRDQASTMVGSDS